MASMPGSQPLRQFQLKGFPNLVKMFGGLPFIIVAILCKGSLGVLLAFLSIAFLLSFYGLKIRKAAPRINPKAAMAQEKHEAKIATQGKVAISPLENDAISALMHLGYTKGDAAVAVGKAMEAGNKEFESIVKAALMQGGR